MQLSALRVKPVSSGDWEEEEEEMTEDRICPSVEATRLAWAADMPRLVVLHSMERVRLVVLGLMVASRRRVW
jgi:hypothetical protein